MDTALQPRRQLEGPGYACGEETRARIISAALRIFGQHGYDQASTRQIAAEAEVNPPALQYYFGGKEGLHRACAQYIVDLTQEILSPGLEMATHALEAGSRPQARAAILKIIDQFAGGLSGSGTESWSRFIARGKADGAGPAMSIIRERIGVPLVGTLTRLIALVRGESALADVNRLRALVLIAPIGWLHANRDNALNAMHWDAFDSKRIELLREVLHAQVRATLQVVPKRARG